MKLGLFACIVACVGVAHVAVIFLISHWRTMGQPYIPPPEPTFTTATYHFVDDKGAEVKRVKEFTVSTEFIDPDKAKAAPAPKK